MTFKGQKHTSATKAKISETQKERYKANPALYANIRKAQAARAETIRTQKKLIEAGVEVQTFHHTAETKAKISAALKSRKPSSECVAENQALLEETRRTKEELRELERNNILFPGKTRRARSKSVPAETPADKDIRLEEEALTRQEKRLAWYGKLKTK